MSILYKNIAGSSMLKTLERQEKCNYEIAV